MQQYLDLLRRIRTEGQFYPDRTGTGAYGVFGAQLRFDLGEGFPLVTTKRLHTKSILHELLWFLSGETNIRPLLERRCTIWTEWCWQPYVKATGDAIGIREFEARILGDEAFARRWGDLGPVYGKQWRRWAAPDGREIDQVANVIEGLRRDPYGRRHIVNAWNPADLGQVALPWCHAFWQFRASPDGKLHLQLYQRSCDTFLGVPFNIASGAFLLSMVAQVVGREPGDFVWTGGDVHVYANHLEQVDLQLTREPRPLPRLVLDPGRREIDEFRFEDFDIVGYDPHPAIKADVAI